MKKLFIFLFLFYSSIYSQQDKFIIGVDWLNSTRYDYINTTLSENYWDLAEDFGLNFGTLNISESAVGAASINTQLTNAHNHGIDIELNSKKIMSNTVGRPRRWMFQVEGDYDFNSHDSQVGQDQNDDEAESHWTKVTEDNVLNYYRLQTVSDNAGYAAYDLVNKDLIPDGSDYYVKIRIRKVSTTSSHTPVVKVIVVNTTNSLPQEQTIYADQLTQNVWMEKDAFEFRKTSSGPAITNGQTNVIITDVQGIAGVVDYEIAPPPPVYTPYDIKVYWYDQVNCDIDYVIIEDEESHDLNTGVFDNLITSTVSNYVNNPGLSKMKVWDEPEPENYLSVRYENRKVQTIFDNNGHPEKNALAFNYVFKDVNPEQYLAQTELEQLRSDNYPIYYSLSIPAIGSTYLNAIQSTFNTNLIYRLNGLKDQIQAAKKFNKPFWFTPQAHSWKTSNREPSAYEIKAMVNLGVCYGAKGIQYFMYSIPYLNDGFDINHTAGVTLLSDDNPSNPVPRYTDSYGYPKWNTLKDLNAKLNSIGDELISLTWQNAFSIHQGQPTGTYIFNVETSVDDQADTYVEVGLFKKTTEINNDNLEYFFVVNRRTLSTEQRTIDVQIHKTSSIFQNWKVTEVGTSNTWVVSKTGSFETLYQPGEGKLFKMEPVMIAGGNIEYDESIPAGSSINVKGNVTVNQYKTLTLGAGCTLSFDPGINLTVNGVLNAQGTSSQPITFTRSGSSGGWGGKIKLNGSGASGSIIKYANISYATQVEAVNVPDFEISNCNFTNNYKAVYVNNSSGLISNNDITSDSVGHVIDIENASTVDCKGNEITKSNKQGFAILYGGGSDGYATENDIYGCDVGIGIIWSSSSSSHSSTYLAKNNRIRNCNDGFKVYRLSSGSFGIPPNDDDARNSIYGNTRNVSVAKSYPTYTASLEAPWNWWGNYPPNQSLFSVGLYGNFVFYPPLSSDPWYGIPKAAPKNIETPLSEESNESVAADIDPESIYYGIELRFQKKYKEAKDYFISYLAKHPDDQRAYVELYNCYSKETANDLINFFTKLPSEASEDHKLLLSYLYLKESRSASEAERQKNIDLAEKVNKNIIEENPNTSLSVRAKINNIYIALFSENNLAKASSIFTEITDKTQLSTERELADVKDAIEIYAGIHKGKGSGNSDSPIIKKDIASIEAPKEYALLGNYPNPFNPSTTISYNLPFISEVEITIYDILGNEVKSFVIPAQNSGTQEIIWNGRNINNEQVSSGIYLYHFKAVSLQKNNEVFEKSAKLILMK